jgi:hypothetical protein
VQQQEPRAAGRGTVAHVQLRHACGRGREQLRIGGGAFGARIGPVGQQREADVAVRASEIVHLEAFDVRGHAGRAGQQRWHDDERPEGVRHAVGELEAGQRGRAEAAYDGAVEERHRSLYRRERSQPREQREHGTRCSTRDEMERPRQDRRRRDRQERDVAADARGRADSPGPVAEAWSKADRVRKRRATVADQDVTGVSFTRRGAFTRMRDGALRDVEFAPRGAAREGFDRGAVEIPRREVHRAVADAGLQDVVDQADVLEQRSPVDRGHRAHAGDDVPHGDVGRALPVVLVAHHRVRARALREQTAVEPRERGGQLRVLVAQPEQQLHREGRAELDALPLPQGVRQRIRIRRYEQTVDELVGALPSGASARDPLRRATEVLDQHDPERDRHRPELADRQRLNALVGAHEADERIRVESAVGVCDERPGDAENARVSRQRPDRELREFPVVALRKVLADLADLRFDDVVVVGEPFGRRRDRAALADGCRDRTVRGQQHDAVVPQTRAQRLHGRRARRHGLGSGQRLGMLLEPLDAEQLGADDVEGVPGGIGCDTLEPQQHRLHLAMCVPAGADQTAPGTGLRSVRHRTLALRGSVGSGGTRSVPADKPRAPGGAFGGRSLADAAAHHALALATHDFVALAAARFEAAAIQHGDQAAAVAYEAGRLQLAGRLGDTFAADAEHVGDQLLRHPQLVGRQPVVAEQQPAAQLLVDRVVTIADRRLRHLRDQRLGVAQQQQLHRPTAHELALQQRRREPVRPALALHDRAAGGRLATHEQRDADQPVVADDRDLGGRTVGEHVQQ